MVLLLSLLRVLAAVLLLLLLGRLMAATLMHLLLLQRLPVAALSPGLLLLLLPHKPLAKQAKETVNRMQVAAAVAVVKMHHQRWKLTLALVTVTMKTIFWMISQDSAAAALAAAVAAAAVAATAVMVIVRMEG
jgi:hypothetical protein